MQETLENIEAFDHRAINEVSEIFMDQLPEDFCSLMGPRFLRKHFLPHFLNTNPHIGYVAKHQGKVTGFILGGRAKGYYSDFIKHHFMALASYSLMACFHDIRRIKYFIDVEQVMYGSDAFHPREYDLELLYISVAGSNQSAGVGSQLVKKLMENGRQYGFDRCVVKTFANSEIANLFYRNCGFEPLHHNRGRIWYSNSLPPENKGLTT